MYKSKRLRKWILWKRFISLYQLVLINYWLLVTVNNQDFHCNSYFPTYIKIWKQYAFLKLSFRVLFLFFSPTLKTQIQVSEYQEAIYGSHKIQIFINITQATGEVLDKHHQHLWEKVLVLKVASSNMSHINTLFMSSQNKKMGKNLIAILPNTT